MSNFLIVGTAGADAVIGTEDAGYSAIGTIIDAERKDGSKQLLIPDRYGNTVAIVYFDFQNKCTINVIFDSTVTLPDIGDALSLCGLTDVLVDNIGLKWATEKEKMVTIEATRFANLTVS